MQDKPHLAALAQSRVTWEIINRLLHVLCRRDVGAFFRCANPFARGSAIRSPGNNGFRRRRAGAPAWSYRQILVTGGAGQAAAVMG